MRHNLTEFQIDKMNNFNDDLIILISSFITNYKDILSLKLLCKEYNKIILKFNILKLLISSKINNYCYLNNCVNINCCTETLDLFENYYRKYYGRYIHYEQPAMNNDTIYINQKPYKVFSPYCCECFKKYILIGDKKDTINNLFCEDFVDIEYIEAKDH
jgi:hypothetical protein